MSTEHLRDELVPNRFGHAFVGERPGSKVLTKPSGFANEYDFSINPYIGCAFGCSYCYAINFVADLDKRQSWGRWVDVKTGAVDEFSRSKAWQGSRLYMSTVTDPYQPVEAKIMLTRNLVALMANAIIQPSLVVQTRSPLVERDLDLFQQFHAVRINLTISTDSDDIRRAFEPSCASIDRRFQVAAKIKEAGIALGICVSPMLPIKSAEHFAERIADLNPEVVVVQDFHRSNRRFAANTAESGLTLASEFRWSAKDYNETLKVMRQCLGCVWEGKEGFMPA